MIYSNRNNFVLILLCLILLNVYSVKSYAQESENEPNSQQTPSAEATHQAETDSEDKTPEQEQNAPFNVDVLVDRMKETKAIGVITKLSLKNQVDDLIEKADEIKNDDGENTEGKSELRENFEGLILKTVTLLNKGEDYTLAEDIYLAREELWKSIMENKA